MKWGNPKSTPTYGQTIYEHGQRKTPQQLIGRANGKNNKTQVGQWLDDQQAADFLADFAINNTEGPGVYDVELPSEIKGRSFMPDGTELDVNMARIIIDWDGSIKTAFPYNSSYPN